MRLTALLFDPPMRAPYLTSPSKENKVNYDCLKDKSLTLLKNMADALDVSKRYYEQLKQKFMTKNKTKTK
jgi:hypothetical protein